MKKTVTMDRLNKLNEMLELLELLVNLHDITLRQRTSLANMAKYDGGREILETRLNYTLKVKAAAHLELDNMLYVYAEEAEEPKGFEEYEELKSLPEHTCCDSDKAEHEQHITKEDYEKMIKDGITVEFTDVHGKKVPVKITVREPEPLPKHTCPVCDVSF